MTEEQFALVQSTWDRVVGVGPLVGGLFHWDLRNGNTSIRPRYTLPNDGHDLLFVDWLSTLVASLHDAARVQSVVAQIQTMYICGNAAEVCMQQFWHGVVSMLSELLGEDFDKQTQQAWAEVEKILLQKPRFA